jgi:predicted NUDIX family NTP pyrophosphohydrolase
MPIQSAAILLYRTRRQSIEVFLIHPGGPFWKNKDAGSWSIPKGIVGPQEDALVAARREFKEETGFELDGDFRLLGTFRQPGGKHVMAYAVEGDCDPAALASNAFSMESSRMAPRLKLMPASSK